MELETAIKILEYHQQWRLGKIDEMIYETKELIEALDIVINEIKNKEIIENTKITYQNEF